MSEWFCPKIKTLKKSVLRKICHTCQTPWPLGEDSQWDTGASPNIWVSSYLPSNKYGYNQFQGHERRWYINFILCDYKRREAFNIKGAHKHQSSMNKTAKDFHLKSKLGLFKYSPVLHPRRFLHGPSPANQALSAAQKVHLAAVYVISQANSTMSLVHQR